MLSPLARHAKFYRQTVVRKPGRLDFRKNKWIQRGQPYHDITDQADKDPRVQLKVEVYINDTDVRTSSKIEGLGSAEYPDNATKSFGLGKGMFQADEQNVKRQMASISVGEVYFRATRGAVSR